MAASAQNKAGEKQAGKPSSPAAARGEAQQGAAGGLYADLAALQGMAGNRAVGRILSASPAPTALPPGARQGLDSSAAPLDPATRSEMEASFGYDFGPVRLHTGGGAARSAKSLYARAYTVGRDIVFGAGAYAPGTPGGKRLLAHELAHVVQQRQAAATWQIGIGARNSGLEREASTTADRAAAGQPAGALSGAATQSVQRAPVETATAETQTAEGQTEETQAGEASLKEIAATIARTMLRTSTEPVEIMAAAIYGLLDQAYQEIVVQGKGEQFVRNMRKMSTSPWLIASFAAGYWTGIFEGIVSPITDLFNLMVFAEQMSSLGREMAANAFANRKGLASEAGELGLAFLKLPEKAIESLRKVGVMEIMELMNARRGFTVQFAENTGRSFGKSLADSLNAAWNEPLEVEVIAKKRGLWHAVTHPLGTISSKIESLKKWMISSPWSQVGEQMGFAIGNVLILIIALMFTGGLGNLISGLSKALRGLSPALKSVAGLIEAAGKAITFADSVLDALMSPAFKLIEPVLKELIPPFRRLQNFLKKLFRSSDEIGGTAGKQLEGAVSLADVVDESLPAPAGVKKTPLPEPEEVTTSLESTETGIQGTPGPAPTPSQVPASAIPQSQSAPGNVPALGSSNAPPQGTPAPSLTPSQAPAGALPQGQPAPSPAPTAQPSPTPLQTPQAPAGSGTAVSQVQQMRTAAQAANLTPLRTTARGTLTASARRLRAKYTALVKDLNAERITGNIYMTGQGFLIGPYDELREFVTDPLTRNTLALPGDPLDVHHIVEMRHQYSTAGVRGQFTRDSAPNVVFTTEFHRLRSPNPAEGSPVAGWLTSRQAELGLTRERGGPNIQFTAREIWEMYEDLYSSPDMRDLLIIARRILGIRSP
jgi:hypothetical protein